MIRPGGGVAKFRVEVRDAIQHRNGSLSREHPLYGRLQHPARVAAIAVLVVRPHAADALHPYRGSPDSDPKRHDPESTDGASVDHQIGSGGSTLPGERDCPFAT